MCACTGGWSAVGPVTILPSFLLGVSPPRPVWCGGAPSSPTCHGLRCISSADRDLPGGTSPSTPLTAPHPPLAWSLATQPAVCATTFLDAQCSPVTGTRRGRHHPFEHAARYLSHIAQEEGCVEAFTLSNWCAVPTFISQLMLAVSTLP